METCLSITKLPFQGYCLQNEKECSHLRDTLEPEVVKSRVAGSQNLCMEQYGRLLNAYRSPGGGGRDSLETSDPCQTREVEHAVIMTRGHVRICKLVWIPYLGIFLF